MATGSTSGLSRRRVANSSTSNIDSSSSSPPSALNNGRSGSSEANPNRPYSNPGQKLNPTSSGSTTTNGLTPDSINSSDHKIAYDPRDLLDSNESSLNPKLTIMEEILLLGLKDKQGYLSFWNDNISYTLRGCILLELALRHRIAMVRDPNRRRFPLPDRYIEVVDDRLTGEVLLDEALKMMKASEKMSVGTWIDLMSGETWNVMKIGYQLKQVRERLAKGLVDKGVLRTEKRNFLLFDMATHPISDSTFKDDVLRRTLSILTSRTVAVPVSDLYQANVRYRTLRAVCMVCASFAANVLENALVHLSYDAREAAFQKCDELLAEFSQWPFGSTGGGSGGQSSNDRSLSPSAQTHIGVGTGGTDVSNANLIEITRVTRAEMIPGDELQLEVVAAVLNVFGKMFVLLHMTLSLLKL
ncbi:Golgi phosphoprotein 3-domain-containing protein [Phakopsora pachyrhizi]|uniref:Vacuolar protein sorting-associated protein 74 n=1 Tax=Phakopsora pachyrhizi TaxID=170000 RepID=A0AAV0BUX9_PHAPC|nr:Golgi phosphoprotein 3-domain-containing protein [Phakopsora pachyrhizi]KAI8448934.1 Golgi phosphoprotein 3-domain-containing protein [Phakopsora pachyrhizi]CAH7689906.1 Golgi phospho protein 3-domain-containing protein [Phakopsora pachyrhizi]